MVQKTTKCGVHSGNTLRASNSKYTKTYRKNSCLVRTIKNSANLRILQDFGVATDDVVYSLNKKGRWVLPNVLKEHILLSGFSEDGPNVQLTESHKIRKPAKCLGYYASKGPIRKAVPSKKRYFNISSVKNLSSPSLENKEQKEGTEEVKECAEPEINVEVYHPTPMSSSLTHNRKYIKPTQHTDFQIQTKNKKTKRRIRNAKSDIDLFEDDLCEEYWDDNNDDVEKENHFSQRPLTFFTAADILKSAAKAKKIFENGKRKCRNPSSEDITPKAKIVYVDEPKESNHKKTLETKRVTQTSEQRKVGYRKEMVPRKVVLSTKETQPEFLKFVYGDKYIECKTFPRTFVINVTDEVKAAMKKTAPMSYKAFLYDLTTLLIFTYDIYAGNANTEETFDMYLNVNVKADIIEPSTLLSYISGSLESIINHAISQVRVFEENQFERLKLYPNGKNEGALNVLDSCWSKSKSSTMSEEELFEEAMQEHGAMSKFEGAEFEALPSEVCFICFETMNENRSGIALESCGHWFCRDCWREHLLNKDFSKLLCPEFNCDKEVDFSTVLQILNISEVRKYLIRRRESLVQMQRKYCPNEKCGRVISTLLATTHTNAACECGIKFCSHCFKFPHWPAPCDTSQQYWGLLKKKGIDITLNDSDYSTPDPDILVQGKVCPKCKRFIEKDGGCYRMLCVCGTSFCWGCQGIFGVNHFDSDHCHQYKHGDLYHTRKMRIKNSEDAQNKMKAESALLQAAVNHRAERALSKTVNMKGTIHSLCQKFRTLGRKSITKIAEILADDNAEEKSLLYVKFEHFLRSMSNLYLEMRHLAEYTAVFVDQNTRSPKRINCILARIESLAAEIYDKLCQDTDADVASLVCDLMDIKDHCMKTVSGLVKLVTK
uniref:RBR-type E3 ubiquitin transferase n=1 Tax=Magallana gigas TaxID=29159 RepID=K1Q5J3_MAGGI|eukprot:XP_011418157.1 PREDICTED: uncharacterized protein LOC105321541 [Crassostrea gigas]